jgi:hypothetical protein
MRTGLGMNGFPDGDVPENTRSMSLRPDNADSIALAETSDEEAALLLCLSGDAFLRAVSYPVIVENWERKKGGRVKREWMKQFTETERNLISRYYAKFYRWYLVSGTPKKVVFRKLKTIHTLQRAVNFFASV